MYTSKNHAFTLAEILTTLGIIGVLAALTIPELITNYKAKKFRSQFLKSYSTVQQVFKQMEADEVSLDPTTYAGGTMHTIFLKYLQNTVDCGKGNNSSNKNFPQCYDYKKSSSKAYTAIDGKTKLGSAWFDDGQIVLSDGALLMFENPNLPSTYTFYAWVFVDLNGFNNKPNRLGIDLFAFEFLDGELRTMGDLQTKYNNIDKYCNFEKDSDVYNGIACAKLAKENPDYFKFVLKNVHR